MAKLRPGRCYRKPKGQAFTRTAKKVVRKARIKGVPASKLTHLDQGNSGRKYKFEVELIAKNFVQIRSNALEACRVIVIRALTKGIGPDAYHFQIRTYPHHVIRENAIISGAGADRLQTGMKHSFGRPAGRAARVKRGKTIFAVKVMTKAHAEIAAKALNKVRAKLPTPCSIKTKELK